MELIFYSLLPFILFFILLEWFYEKILAVVYWFMGIEGPEPEGPGGDFSPDDDRDGGRERQGTGLQAPDAKRREAGGMASQERKIPQIIPDETRPEPEPAKKPKPKPFVFDERPRGKIKPKGRGKQDDKDRGR